jgi:hypothetical protein
MYVIRHNNDLRVRLGRVPASRSMTLQDANREDEN